MPLIRFTKSNIESLRLKPGERECKYFDTSLKGFGIRLQGAASTWIVQYRLNGKTRRVTLGRVGVLSFERAKKAAKEELASAGLGIDTREEKRKARKEANKTLGPLVELYLKDYEPRVRHNTYRSTKLYLQTHWKPLHSAPVGKIDHSDVARHLAIIRDGSGDSSANHARVALSGFYAWAVEHGHTDNNPVMLIRARRRAKAQARGRTRCLSALELKEVWKACEDDNFGSIVRLLILTLQRREEIAALSWSEIDFSNKTIELPSHRTKNGYEHLLPLSDESIRILRAAPHRKDVDYLFGKSDSPFSGFSKAKKTLDQRILYSRQKLDPNANPMPHWTLHDLRRTGSTLMHDSPADGGLGTPPHVVEAILNHLSGAKGGVAGVYNKAQYLSEKREALNQWAKLVLFGGLGKPSTTSAQL